MFQAGLGLDKHFDVRNLDYRIKDVVPLNDDLSALAVAAARTSLDVDTPAVRGLVETPTARYCNDSAWWGDQGDTPHCTAYALLHAMADGAVTHPGQNPLADPTELYDAIVRRDRAANRWFPAGATSLAMAQEAVARRWIGEFRWGYTLDEFIAPLLRGEPVLLGIDWPDGMDEPSKEGIVRWRGRNRGGHEIEANGINLRRGLARLKQSWDRRTYGLNGHVYIPLEDVAAAIAAQGDVLLFRELRTDDPRTRRDESK